MKEQTHQNPRYGWDPVALIPWDVFSSLFTFYIMIQMGLQAFLDQTHTLMNKIMYWLDVASIIVFILSIPIQFRRGYYHKGQLILDRHRIVLNYSILRLIMDCLVVFLIGITLLPKLRFNPLRIIIWWRIYFLFKLDNNIFRGLHSRFGWFVVYTFFKLLVIFYMFCHYMGCIYYWIDYGLVRDQYMGLAGYLEMAVYYEYLWSPILSESWYMQYMYTMYYSIETFTTIAYGDNTPKNPYQTIFVTFFLILSAVMLSYILEQIVILLYQFSKNRILYLRKLFAIHRYLVLKDIDPDLQDKLINYYEYLWWEERLLKDSQLSKIMAKLPTFLRGRLVNQIFFSYFSSIDFLVLMNPTLCDKVVQIAIERMALDQQVIFEPQQHNTTSLFLVKPKQAHSLHRTPLQSRSLTAFGQYQFFTTVRNLFGMLILKQNVLYEIPRPTFLLLLKKYSPDTYFKFILRKQQILSKHINVFGMCEICESDEHNIVSCPKMHYCVQVTALVWKQRKVVNQRGRFEREGKRNRRVGFGRVVGVGVTGRNSKERIRGYLNQMERLVRQAQNQEEYSEDFQQVFRIPDSAENYNLSNISF